MRRYSGFIVLMLIMSLCVMSCGNDPQFLPASDATKDQSVSETASGTVQISSDVMDVKADSGSVEDSAMTPVSSVSGSGVSPSSILYNLVEAETAYDAVSSVSQAFVSGNSVSKDSLSEDEVISGNHLCLSLETSGSDIFVPKASGLDYRYGASFIADGDSVDAYFSSPGDGSVELDLISYRHSDDGGKTWSDEKIVLTPTPLSKDRLSVCDPDVFYYGGYYYIGYTATMDIVKKGYLNNVFLARSKNPDGPFEKWNGKGWGGMPEPVIYYDGMWNGWGTGEPSFVVMGSKIYLYCTRDGYAKDNARVRSTELYVAGLGSESWPSLLEHKGPAIVRTDGTVSGDSYVYADSDSVDVVYLDKYKKFLGMNANRRFEKDSSLVYYESDDGVSFNRVSELNRNVCCGAHNVGMRSDRTGHVSGNSVDIIYAYGGSNNSWGVWSDRYVTADISMVDDIVSEDGDHNVDVSVSRGITERPSQLKAGSLFKSIKIGDVFVFGFSASGADAVKDSDVDFSDYDENIIQIENGQVKAVANGDTAVTASYEGMNRHLAVSVTDMGAILPFVLDPSAIESPVSGYRVSMSEDYNVCIRPLVVYSDGSRAEIAFDLVFGGAVTFTSTDPSVCTVRADGIIDPVSEGHADIVVSCGDVPAYTVDVVVKE